MKELVGLGSVLAGLAMFVACGSETVKEIEIIQTIEVIEEVPTPVVRVSGEVALLLGATATFTATTENGTDSGYTWETSAAAVATVDETGVVTGVAAGTAIISATGKESGAKGSWGIHIYEEAEEPQPEPRVMVSGEIQVMVGATSTLEAVTVDGEDTGYDWASSDEAIATVDEGGVVTGVAQGPVTITATGKDSAAAGSWNMFVLAEPVINPPEPQIVITGGLSMFEGGTVALLATTVDGEDTGYTWESSAPEIASVDETGLVTGLAPGEALIKATGNDTQAFAQHGVVVIEEGVVVPFEELWLGSGHADEEAEAFIHWDESDPPVVPTTCAKCHSANGYLDYLGLDGTEPGVVDNAAVPSVITCGACHNSATAKMDSVLFPSGALISGLGKEARCMQCHQGRESTVSVNAALEKAAPVDDDTVTPALSFKNVHYFAAGATLFGGDVQGGYEYTDNYYDGKFVHSPGVDNCTACHNVHSLEVKVENCGECHAGVEAEEDLTTIRMPGSFADYDGDGDTAESMEAELEGLRDELYAAIQKYAKDVAGAALVYSSASHPYFFIDTNGNGQVDDGEAVSANKYVNWTPRLLKAAYNMQYSLKDPGAHAHNAKYVVELLYDSIASLAEKTGQDIAELERNDEGHFNSLSEAFRHWDGDGKVSASCARCHSAGGFDFWAANGVDSAVTVTPSGGLHCCTCHTGEEYANGAPRKYIAQVTFPSDVSVKNSADAPDDSFICMSCHKGRESMKTVDAAIATGKPAFKNVHYAAAGATLYGTDAKVGYEYAGKTYAGKFPHYSADGAKCTYCHAADNKEHSFEPTLTTTCKGCHPEAAGDLAKIRKTAIDFDGDGNKTETLAAELEAVSELLYAEIQKVANAAAKPIVYSAASYPYWFKDTNGNGLLDEGEGTSANGYKDWTIATSKAAFNFQLYHKEAGAWAHNPKYMAQLLIDSIADLGGDVSKLNRP